MKDMRAAAQPGSSPKSSSPKPQKKIRAARITREQDKGRRATVSLSADSSEIVNRFKAATGLSTSRAIEELILRSEQRPPRIKMVEGLAVFDVELANGSITTEEILELEDRLW